MGGNGALTTSRAAISVQVFTEDEELAMGEVPYLPRGLGRGAGENNAETVHSTREHYSIQASGNSLNFIDDRSALSLQTIQVSQMSFQRARHFFVYRYKLLH